MVRNKRHQSRDRTLDVEPATLNVKTTTIRRQQFHAACQLHGLSIQDAINRFMVETIEEAGIREPQPA